MVPAPHCMISVDLYVYKQHYTMSFPRTMYNFRDSQLPGTPGTYTAGDVSTNTSRVFGTNIRRSSTVKEVWRVTSRSSRLVFFIVTCVVVTAAVIMSALGLAHVTKGIDITGHVSCSNGVCTMAPGAVARLVSPDGQTRVDLHANSEGMQIDVIGITNASTSVIGADGSIRTANAKTGQPVLSVDSECMSQLSDYGSSACASSNMITM